MRFDPSIVIVKQSSIVSRLLLVNSLWLWRWLSHRLSKRQSLSTTTVLFRTTFTRTIKLNLLFRQLCLSPKIEYRTCSNKLLRKTLTLIFTASCRFYHSFKDQYESTAFCALFYLIMFGDTRQMIKSDFLEREL